MAAKPIATWSMCARTNNNATSGCPFSGTCSTLPTVLGDMSSDLHPPGRRTRVADSWPGDVQDEKGPIHSMTIGTWQQTPPRGILRSDREKSAAQPEKQNPEKKIGRQHQASACTVRPARTSPGRCALFVCRWPRIRRAIPRASIHPARARLSTRSGDRMAASVLHSPQETPEPTLARQRLRPRPVAPFQGRKIWLRFWCTPRSKTAAIRRHPWQAADLGAPA